MIETYYDIITKIENFVDGLMIVDADGIIRYNKQFNEGRFRIDEASSIGKTPMEIFPNISEETSTCYRALKYGETTHNERQVLRHVDGGEIEVIDNTFPIIEDGKIIGAVSTSTYVREHGDKPMIDLSNMTTSKRTDLYRLSDLVGDSDAMRKLKYKIHKIAPTHANVLIHGETGTGKELVAQALHAHSHRSSALFISQNCAAIPHNLLESIFFGTTKGSYTGAVDKAGIFELADGGTIFLDELNSMDLSMQAKLLKAIEEKKITRIGGSKTKRIDVRIIAAMNQPPETCIAEGKMREDLYYRLSSIQIRVPTLRERVADLEVLVDHFIGYYNREMHKEIRGVDDEAMALLRQYPWPGNVRELKNAMEGAFIFCTPPNLTASDFPETLRTQEGKLSMVETEHLALPDAIDAFEIGMIRRHAVDASSLSEVADRLGISKQALHYKLKKHDLQLKL